MARTLLYLRLVRKQATHWLYVGLGGLAGTILDVLTLITLVESGLAVAPAAFLGATAGAGACFLINKYGAFRDDSPLSLRQVGAFGMVAVGSALLMAMAMQLVAVGLGVPYLVAKLVCAVVIFALWSYPAQRQLVFRTPSVATRARPAHFDPDPGASLA